MAKKKKPLVGVEIDCPKCGSVLQVAVHRKRLNPVDPPEYEYNTDVECRHTGKLFEEWEKSQAKKKKGKEDA